MSLPTIGLQKVNNGQAFPYDGKIFVFLVVLFSKRAGSRFPKAPLQNISRKDFSKNWVRKVNIKKNHIPKIDPTLKVSDCKANTQITHVSRTKAHMFMPCFRQILYLCTRVL